MKRASSLGANSRVSLSGAYEPAAGGLATSGNMASNLQHPSCMSLYSAPPLHVITIDQFEQLAIGRLHVLRAVETASVKGLRDDDMSAAVKKAQDKHLPLHSNDSAAAFNVDEERKNDVTSHWLLRLAFASNSDTSRWFVDHEWRLFKTRYSMSNARDRADFLRSVSLPYEHLGREEKTALADLLAGSTAHSSNVEAEDFIKVPWTHVTDLVSRRLVLLHKGFAYVPKSDLFSVISNRYRETLEQDMERMSRELHGSLRDERLLSLLQAIRTADLEPVAGVAAKTGELTAADIDSHAAHFPPCMALLLRKAKTDKHLKYNGRQQLGLYLKAIGLPFPEAMVFWKRAFSKFTDDDFAKNYSYNVRHNYGMEGKRANYGCLNCKTIIAMAQPGGSEYHGCPFRHADSESLSLLLQAQYGLTNESVKEIDGMARSHHYQMACSRALELARPGAFKGTPEPIVVPTQFYEQSLAHSLRAQGAKK